MNCRFDEEINRRGSMSMKWDLVKDPDVIPLWVADTDFKSAPAVVDAVCKFAKTGVYGYSHIPDEYYQAIISWHLRHYGVSIKKEWILTAYAIAPALTATLQALTLPGDRLVVQTPAYNSFFYCFRNSGVEVAANPLSYQDGKFFLNLEDLERQCAHERSRVMLICNPHNPTGRLWTLEELEHMAAIAKKHDLIVISDEIHCDIRPKDSVFISFSKVADKYGLADNLITLRSASKTFNTAGLMNSYLICQNMKIRNRIDRALNINEVCEVPVIGLAAVTAAYNEGDNWVLELNDYIRGNYRLLKDFFLENFPKVKVIDLQSTYLAWLDCSCFRLSDAQLEKILLDDGKLLINTGELYHSPYPGFIRVNLGCTRQTLREALSRFKKVFDSLQADLAS